MRAIDDIIEEKLDLEGWTWTIYSATSSLPARVVVTSPDYKRHIGRDASSIEEAIRLVKEAVKEGLRS